MNSVPAAPSVETAGLELVQRGEDDEEQQDRDDLGQGTLLNLMAPEDGTVWPQIAQGSARGQAPACDKSACMKKGSAFYR